MWPTKEERQAHKGPWMHRNPATGELTVGEFSEDADGLAFRSGANKTFEDSFIRCICLVGNEYVQKNVSAKDDLVFWPIDGKTGMRVVSPVELQQSNGLALHEFIATLRKEGYTAEQIALLLDAQIRVIPAPDGAPLLVSSKDQALTQPQMQQLTRLIRRYQATGPIIYVPPDLELATPTITALATQLYEACRSDDLNGVSWDGLTEECRESWLAKARRFDLLAVFSEKVEPKNVFTLTR